MLNPTPATVDAAEGAEPTGALTAYCEEAPAGLFTAPVDVSLLEQLEFDELGRRRSRWLPSDVLL